jgi:hypothetical protein
MALKMSDKPQIEVPKDDEPGTGAVEVAIQPENEAVRPVEERFEQHQDALATQIQQLNAAEVARYQAQQQQHAAYQEHLAQERRAREQSDYDSIVHAVSAKQEELDSARRDLKEAWDRQDFETAAYAQQRMHDIQIDLKELSKGYEEQPQQQYPQPQPQPQYQQPQRQWTPEDTLNAMPNLWPSDREWALKDEAHRNLLMSREGISAVTDAYYHATNAGHQRGTAGLYQFMDQHLGLLNGGGDQQIAEQPAEQPAQPPRRAPVSAPVSRGSHNISTGHHQESSSKIVLSPQQREAARWSGVDEVTYAKNLRKLQELKKAGFYNEG